MFLEENLKENMFEIDNAEEIKEKRDPNKYAEAMYCVDDFSGPIRKRKQIDFL